MARLAVCGGIKLAGRFTSYIKWMGKLPEERKMGGRVCELKWFADASSLYIDSSSAG